MVIKTAGCGEIVILKTINQDQNKNSFQPKLSKASIENWFKRTRTSLIIIMPALCYLKLVWNIIVYRSNFIAQQAAIMTWQKTSQF